MQYEIGKCEYRNRQFFPKHLIEKCCWFSLLIDAFRAPFNKQPGNTYPKNLDYKKLWEICSAVNPTKFGSEYDIEVLQSGLTFQDVRPFFETFGLGCILMDVNHNVLNCIVATNKKTSPRTIYVLYTDNHVHRLHAMGGETRLHRRAHAGILELTPSMPRRMSKYTRFPPREYKPSPHEEVVIFDPLGIYQDGVTLTQLLQDARFEGKGSVLVLVNEDPVEHLIRPLLDMGIRPAVSGTEQSITGVYLGSIMGRKKLRFDAAKTATCQVTMASATQYHAFAREQHALATECRSKDLLSTYSPGVLQSLRNRGRGGVVAWLNDDRDPEHGADINKHYLTALMELPSLPYVTAFHEWEELDRPRTWTKPCKCCGRVAWG